MMSLKSIFSFFLLMVFSAFCVFNGLAMMISPKRWLQLPPLVGFQGSMRGKDGDDPWIALQIRGLGLACLLFFLSCVWLVTGGFTFVPRLAQ